MRESNLNNFINAYKIINSTPNNNHCVKPQVSDLLIFLGISSQVGVPWRKKSGSI